MWYLNRSVTHHEWANLAEFNITIQRSDDGEGVYAFMPTMADPVAKSYLNRAIAGEWRRVA